MEFISNLIYFILVIGVLVTIHEFGHFIAARLTGMRADIFCIGMGPRLFGWNKISGFTFGKLNDDWQGNGHTDYRISAFPIGGYVKILGMIDESMDTNFVNTEPQPWEFRSKNAWQKAFVLSAGVIMNILLAIVIFIILSFTIGRTELISTTVGIVDPNSVAEKIGFQMNDKINTINNKKIKNWNDVITNLTTGNFGSTLNISVVRNNENVFLTANGNEVVKSFAQKMPLGLNPGGVFTYIDKLMPKKPAEIIGMKKGDTILAVNGIQINTASIMQSTLQKYKASKVEIKWKRNTQIMTDSLVTTETGMIGVQLGFGPISNIKYGFFESVVVGTQEFAAKLEFLVNSIFQMVNGNVSFKESVGGPLMIFDMTAQQAEKGIPDILNFIAILSISLAFMNILPFPALDGGHLVFVIIEGIVRRELPVKVKMYIQQAGVVLIIAFTVFVLWNDISRILK